MAAAVAGVTLLASTGYAGVHMYRSAQLAKASKPFETTGMVGAAKVLVIGDSTAEGTGASRPEASLAGLVAQAAPGVSIINRGRDGARFGEFASQLPPQDEHFDAILIVGGGNDVIRFTRDAALRQAVNEVARAAAARAPLVVFIPPGNVGNAPFFLPPWRWVMSRRAARLHDIVSTAAKSSASLYVDLYEERAEDPFAQQPQRMNARDGLHPSDKGYRLWHDELERQTGISEHLKAAGRLKR